MSAWPRERNQAGATPTIEYASPLSSKILPYCIPRATEVPLPKPVAENGDMVSSWLVLAHQKGPADLRLDSEQRKEIGLGPDNVGRLRFARTAGVKALSPVK